MKSIRLRRAPWPWKTWHGHELEHRDEPADLSDSRRRDKISVVANPLRSGEPSGKYVAITLPDGRVLGEQEAVLGE